MSRITSGTARVPIPPVDLTSITPITKPETPLVEQLGPVVFQSSPGAEHVRSTLNGVDKQIDNAIRAAHGLGDKTSAAQLVSRLRAVEKSLSSGAVDASALEANLSVAEQWAIGLDLGRSLRALSAAVGQKLEQLPDNVRRDVEQTFTNIGQALDAGAGVLPSVRLPPPRSTIAAHTMRLEADDLALVQFAASLDTKDAATLREILKSSPSDPLLVLDLLKSKADPQMELKRLALMFPPDSDPAQLGAKLDADLAYRGRDLKQAMSKLLEGFGVKDTGPLFDMLATAREAFSRGAAGSEDVPANTFDTAGWIHTRLEMLHSLKALQSIRERLPADQADAVDWPTLSKAVWLGTLSSDLYKRGDFHSILTHNRDGAELMAPLLAGRHLGDLDAPEAHRVLSLAKRFAHDHQIIPAGLMAFLTGLHITGKPFDHDPVTASIMKKIANPFATEQKDGEIVFTDAEQAVLRKAGMSGWAVPSAEGDLERLIGALAVQAGDAEQYGTEDGVLKYNYVRGPDKGAMFSPIVSSLSYFLRHADRAAELDPSLDKGAPQDLAAQLEQGKLDGVPQNGTDDHRGAIESAFFGSHAGCAATFSAAAPVIGEAMANALIAHLDAQRGETAKKWPALTARAEALIRAQTGVREVAYWDVPVTKDQVDDERVKEDVALVRAAFAQATDEVLGIPAKPFAIENGAKS